MTLLELSYVDMTTPFSGPCDVTEEPDVPVGWVTAPTASKNTTYLHTVNSL